MTAAGVFLVCLAAPAARAAAPQKSGPSENKGRRGTYQGQTSHSGCNYYVCVPDSYSDDDPAGLHVFFHGQGGQGGAPHFGRWAKYFLGPHNLIGINMQYADGDNANDTAGKVQAAIEAILQTAADYKVILGRGAVASFSGGGLPHGMLYGRFNGHREKTCQGVRWPFNHTSLYGSNYWRSADGGLPMSWYVGIGTGEWRMGKPTLGTTLVARTRELFAGAAKGGCPDIYLKVTKGKGHAIAEADVAQSAKSFQRSDLAFAPFVYEPDYGEKELRPIVAAANAPSLGPALKALERLLARRTTSGELRSKAERLKKRLEARVRSAMDLSRELFATDPILANFYGRHFMQQLAGLPEARELRKGMLEAFRKKRSYPRALTLPGAFEKELASLFAAGGALRPDQVPFLESARTVAGERSHLGSMIADLLLLR